MGGREEGEGRRKEGEKERERPRRGNWKMGGGWKLD